MSNARTGFWVAFFFLIAAGACSDNESHDGDDATIPADGGVDGSGPADGSPTREGGTVPSGEFLSRANLERITAYLASDELQGREEGSPGGVKARQFIINELKQCGVEPAGENGTFEQKITTGEGANVLGLVKGTGAEESKRKVLICAHHDHLGVQSDGSVYNGAYDNAAGVALVIGVACELAKNPPLRSVLVVSWDAEEPPTFLTNAMGSQFYVDHPLVPLDQIDVVVLVDLIASDMWPGAGLHFAAGAEKSPEVLRAVQLAKTPAGLTTFRLGMHLAEEQPIGHQPWGDYDAFRNAGVPYLFLTDAQTKVYHTTNDDMTNLVADKLPLEAAYFHSIVETLVQTPASEYEQPTFSASAEDYAHDAEIAVALLELALSKGALVDFLKLTAASKDKLEADLAAVKQVNSSLKAGGQATDAAIKALRLAVQRLMCLAGTSYPENICSMF